MNQLTDQNYQPLNATQIKTLTTETKETTLTQNQLKKFSIVDLWSIQKSRKTTAFRSSMAI